MTRGCGEGSPGTRHSPLPRNCPTTDLHRHPLTTYDCCLTALLRRRILTRKGPSHARESRRTASGEGHIYWEHLTRSLHSGERLPVTQNTSYVKSCSDQGCTFLMSVTSVHLRVLGPLKELERLRMVGVVLYPYSRGKNVLIHFSSFSLTFQ